MGGTGSGSWTPNVPSSPCERVNFRATINSPQPAVIASLKLGDSLDVALQTTPTTVIVVLHDGLVAGSLAGTGVMQLISCIQNGFTYEATVVAINGANCTVQVTPK